MALNSIASHLEKSFYTKSLKNLKKNEIKLKKKKKRMNDLMISKSMIAEIGKKIKLNNGNKIKNL